MGVPRPSHGPAVPGPVWSLAHDLCCICDHQFTIAEDLYMDAACIQRAWRLHASARREFISEVSMAEASCPVLERELVPSDLEVAALEGDGDVLRAQTDSGANIVIFKAESLIHTCCVATPTQSGSSDIALASQDTLASSGKAVLSVVVNPPVFEQKSPKFSSRGLRPRTPGRSPRRLKKAVYTTTGPPRPEPERASGHEKMRVRGDTVLLDYFAVKKTLQPAGRGCLSLSLRPSCPRRSRTRRSTCGPPSSGASPTRPSRPPRPTGCSAPCASCR